MGTFNQCQRASCNFAQSVDTSRLAPFNQCQRASCNRCARQHSAICHSFNQCQRASCNLASAARFRRASFLQPVPTCELQHYFAPCTSSLMRLQPVPTCELQRCIRQKMNTCTTFNQCQRASCNFVNAIFHKSALAFNQCQRASCNGKNAQNTDHARIIVCILTFSSARPSSKMKKNGCYLDLGTGRRPDRR